MKLRSLVDDRSGSVKVYYDYTCPNSESYGEKFCKRKKIKMQDLEEAVEAALRLYNFHQLIQLAMVFVERFRPYLANSRSCRASGIPLTYLAFMIPATRDGVAMLPPEISGWIFSGRFIELHSGQL